MMEHQSLTHTYQWPQQSNSLLMTVPPQQVTPINSTYFFMLHPLDHATVTFLVILKERYVLLHSHNNENISLHLSGKPSGQQPDEHTSAATDISDAISPAGEHDFLHCCCIAMPCSPVCTLM